MILAFHSIFTTYGFWLPNEPRGSWSDFVASFDLLKFGPATKTHARRSLARRSYDPAVKKQMQAALRHPPVRFTRPQIEVIAAAFADTPYTFHALAVLPDHVHAVIAHTPRQIRQVVGHLKSEATRGLRARGWFAGHTPWVQHGWNVYLDSDADVERAVGYVNANPLRAGMAAQDWAFVTPYDPTRSRAAIARRKRRG